MKKFKFLGIILLILGSAFAVSSFFGSFASKDLRSKKVQKKNEINFVTAKHITHRVNIKSYGRAYAYDKVELFAEVSGVLERKSVRFRPGNYFNKGDLLIKINSDVYENTLKAQKSNLLNQITLMLADLKIDFPSSYKNWLEFLDSYDLNKPLGKLPDPETDKEKFFISSKNIYKLYYEIKSMEKTFEKYELRAPFNGLLTVANINPGTLVRNGQKLGEFINTDTFEIKAPVASRDLKFIKVGTLCRLTDLDNRIKLNGKVVRISPNIDLSSQTVNVFIQAKSKKILDGMFFNINFDSGTIDNVSQIPQKAVENGYVTLLNGEKKSKISVEIVDKSNDSYFVLGIPESSKVIISN